MYIDIDSAYLMNICLWTQPLVEWYKLNFYIILVSAKITNFKTLKNVMSELFRNEFRTSFKTQLWILKPAENIPVGLPSHPIKFWGKSVDGVPELWLEIKTNKQRLVI